MTKTRTATIERYHCFGTPRYHLRVTYKGELLRWRSGGMSVVADAVDYGNETFMAMWAHARNHGFTHVRVAGDWTGRTKPRGGKIQPCPTIIRNKK